jgi:hypothetical protein
MFATTAKMLDGGDEHAFGRCLHRAAIRAGNVIDKTNLKTIHVEGLPPFIQAGLRMHLTPDMSFDKVQRLAFSLGTSLSQTILQSNQTTAKVKVPLGSKTFLPRPGSVHSLEVTDVEENHDAGPKGSDIVTPAQVEIALAHTQLQSALSISSPLTGRRSWEASSRSPSPSVVSIPTRGWVSPRGSVMSEPMQRVRSISPSRLEGANRRYASSAMGQAIFWLSVTVCRPSYKRKCQTIGKLFKRMDPVGVVHLRALLELRPWRPRPDREKWSCQPIWRAVPLRHMSLKNPKFRPRCLRRSLWTTNIGTRRKSRRKPARGGCPFQGRIR